MKKLLTGVIASAALIFGFASCSGELNNYEPKPLMISGLTGLVAAPLEYVDTEGNEQKITFKYDASWSIKDAAGNDAKLTGGWGEGSADLEGNLSFKIIDPTTLKANGEPDWTGDYGFENDIDTAIPIVSADGDFSEVWIRGSHNNPTNPGNILASGLVQGNEYTIRVKFADSDKKTLKIRIEGEGSAAGPSKPEQCVASIDGAMKVMEAVKAGKTYTLSMDNADGKAAATIKLSGFYYDAKVYGFEMPETDIEFDKEYNLAENKSAVDIPLDWEKYKSYTMTVNVASADDVNTLTIVFSAEKNAGFYIQGDMTFGWEEVPVLEEGKYYAYTFTYASTMTAWRGTGFKVAADKDWKDDFGYGKQALVLNGDFVELASRAATKADPGNIGLPTLTEGTTYTIYVDISGYADKKVKIKIADK